MVGNHRTIYNESLIYLFVKIEPIRILYPFYRLLSKWKNGQFSPFFLLEDCGIAPMVLCAECTLEPRNRAGVHSLVQARSFLYYRARTRLQLPRLDLFTKV